MRRFLLVKIVAIKLFERFKVKCNYNLRVPIYFALNHFETPGWHIYNSWLDLELATTTHNFLSTRSNKAQIQANITLLRWRGVIPLDSHFRIARPCYLMAMSAEIPYSYRQTVILTAVEDISND